MSESSVFQNSAHLECLKSFGFVPVIFDITVVFMVQDKGTLVILKQKSLVYSILTGRNSYNLQRYLKLERSKLWRYPKLEKSVLAVWNRSFFAHWDCFFQSALLLLCGLTIWIAKLQGSESQVGIKWYRWILQFLPVSWACTHAVIAVVGNS